MADVTAWEAQHGRIPPRSWVLLRTDWSKKSGRDYVNMREDGQHTLREAFPAAGQVFRYLWGG